MPAQLFGEVKFPYDEALPTSPKPSRTRQSSKRSGTILSPTSASLAAKQCSVSTGMHRHVYSFRGWSIRVQNMTAWNEETRVWRVHLTPFISYLSYF
ncbi:hypothetical protein ARMGADRAFT_498515 [Armillaria gallica]|uniref:Uncharacterized protein n=1 Tax=Armillaria gallica TaxID=47427 RepID=A0A2H3EDL1_ARMGA|nr:hypothetical protein ARMGADRAFT_498515 [Armillaria gallica]